MKMNLLISLLLFSGAAGALGATITFQQGATNEFVSGYTGTSDTALASNVANRNGGALDYFSVGRNFSRRSILRFDLSSMTNAVESVQGAQLTLKLGGNATSTKLTISVYELALANAGWLEGGGNLTAVAAAGEVTWSHLGYDTRAWAGSPGAGLSGTDYIATPVATFEWEVGSTSVELNLSAAMIQRWIETPSSNAGLLFVATNGAGENAMTANFASSEHATAGLRPLLAIDYTPVPEPGTWAALLVGGAVLAWRRKGRVA